MGNQRRKYAKRFAFGEKADPGERPPVALLLLAAAPGKDAGFGTAVNLIRPAFKPVARPGHLLQGSTPPAENRIATGGGFSLGSRRFKKAGLLINA